MARGTSSGNYYTVAKSYSGATEFSAAAWIYYSTDSNGTIAGLWEDGGGLRQWLLYKNSSNQGLFAIVDSVSSLRVITAGSLSKNAWQHVALTFSSSDVLRGYVNGSEVGTSVVNGGLDTETDPFGIGARQAGNQAFVGRIAEVATWTKQLTAAQVASLADGFAPPKVLKPDCYIPMVRNVVDLANKYTITTAGTPTVENHPRIYV